MTGANRVACDSSITMARSARRPAMHQVFKFLLIVQLCLQSFNQSIRPAASLQPRSNNTQFDTTSDQRLARSRTNREIYHREYIKDYKRLIRDQAGQLDDSVANVVFDQYTDELRNNFKILYKEETNDERLANVIYATTTKRVLNIDFAKFDSGDPKQDALNEYLVLSDLVDDRLCERHLNQLVNLMDELETKLEQKRQNRSLEFQVELRHLHLARFLDSFGRYESGSMGGATHSMGIYDQCLTSPLMLNPRSERETVGSRYCWAKLSIEKNLDPTLRARQKLPFEGKSSSLSVGICIPETCHTRHFKQHKKLFQRILDTQFRLPKSIYIDETLELESIFCIVDANSRLGMPASGYAFICFLAVWLLLTAYATIWCAEIKLIKSGPLRRLLICLNLYNSWREFTTKPKSSVSSKDQNGRRVELNALNPIRWAGCVFVVYGHAILMRGGHMMNQFYGLMRAEEEYLGGFIIVGTTVVDSFFVMTAMTAAYITLRRAHYSRLATGKAQLANLASAAPKTPTPTTMTPTLTTPINGCKGCKNGFGNSELLMIESPTEKLQGKLGKQQLDLAASAARQRHGPTSQLMALLLGSIKIIEMRYFRLLPMLILVYWFKRSVFIYLSLGPFWDHGFNQETANGACQQESWLVPFTFTASFIPLSRQCLMQSWSVSNDMFFFIVAAPIMLIASRRVKAAATIIVGLCIASIYALLQAIANSDPIDDFEIRDLRSLGFFSLFAKNSYIYSFPHYRVSAFGLGLVAGYLLYCYDTKKIDRWPGWFRRVAFNTALLYILAMFLILGNGAKFKTYVTPYHYFLYPWFMSIGKIMWSLANSIVFLRLVTDLNKHPLIKAFSGKFWMMNSKLNYCILLIHYDLLQYNEINPPQTNYATIWSVYQSFSSVYLASIFISIFLYVILENPLDKLVRTFIVRMKHAT